jgi:hypothetical protein
MQEVQPERVPTPPQEYRKSGLPRRKVKLPKRFEDILPPRPPVEAAPTINTPQPSQASQHESEVPAIPGFKTDPNSFSVYRIYKSGEPSFTPDDNFHIGKVSDGPNFIQDPSSAHSTWASPFGTNFTSSDPPGDSETTPSYLPFKNISIFRLMNWFYNSSLTKSLSTLNNLVHKVLLAPDFDITDLNDFDAAKEARRLDDYHPSSAGHGEGTSGSTAEGNSKTLKDGWIETAVPISVPCDKVTHPSEADAPIFHVKGLMYRKLIEVIKAAYQDSSAEQLHISPYEEYWQPTTDSPPERIYSELYNSNAYIQEHEKVRSQLQPGCELETVIAPLMISSDATHLTSFGNASLWPIYLYLGSLSKYIRAKPSSFSAHHLAYIPKVRLK